MTADMFATLDRVVSLVDGGKQNEAYVLMRDAVKEDQYGFARIFLEQWVKHLREEDKKVQSKFVPLIQSLKADFPEIKALNDPEPETLPANHSLTKISEEIQPKETLTLSFYDWQMNSIVKAAIREKVDESTLIARMLETGNLEPLTWARYKRGKASLDHRIKVKVTSETKKQLDEKKDTEDLSLTKYVRRLFFGDRSERY